MIKGAGPMQCGDAGEDGPVRSVKGEGFAGSGCRVEGLGFGVLGYGSRVWG